MDLKQLISNRIEESHCEAALLQVMARMSRWAPAKVGNFKTSRRLRTADRPQKSKKRSNSPGSQLKKYLCTDIVGVWKGWEACHLSSSDECYSHASDMVLLPNAFHGLLDEWPVAQDVFNYRRKEHFNLSPRAALKGNPPYKVAGVSGYEIRAYQIVQTVDNLVVVRVTFVNRLGEDLNKTMKFEIGEDGRVVGCEAKERSLNNLKAIGLAIVQYSTDYDDKMPPSLDDAAFRHYFPSDDNSLIDPASDQRYVYVGRGQKWGTNNTVVAYSPTDENGRFVLFADDHVLWLTSEQFAKLPTADR